MAEQDVQFFAQHEDRNARIRKPEGREMNGEFWSLGPHESARRRLLVWRVPKTHPMYRQYPVLTIPFLLFADETIEDTDAVLLPMIHKIMKDARAKGAGR
jgi:hypothetical protein